ncbi:Alpha/Beta hydrolase protein [Aspergillus crustosus]
MYSLNYLALLCSLASAHLQPEWVHFDSDGISIAAHLYVPPNNSTWNTSRPAIFIAERTGFVTLTFDAAYQGESGGLPRYLEDPYQRADDVRNAVTFLSTLDFVNASRIGALGVCTSGGYVPFAAQTDERIRAVATVSGIDLGTLYSKGFGIYNSPMQDSLREQLLESGRQRIHEAEGTKPNLTRIFPQTAADVTPDLPIFYQESYNYYQTPRGH